MYLIANNINGQTMDSTLQKMLDTKLIDEKQVENFTKDISHQEKRDSALYLDGLYELEFEKTIGRSSSAIRTYIRFDRLNTVEQKKVNEDLGVYLIKLKACSLITVQQFASQSEKIKNNTYTQLLQFLPALSNQIASEEWLTPDKIIEFGETLLTNDVISEKSFKALKNDANSGKIKSHYQLIDYCNYALFFDLAKYSNDPSVYLERIHQEVSSLLPGLSFTNFKYKIEVDSSESFDDYTAHQVIVSLKANDRTYKQKSSIAPENMDKYNSYFGKIDSHEFYQVFNKVLADNQSPFRLHQIRFKFRYGQGKSNQYFGIIALKDEQANMLRSSGGYVELGYEDFRNSFTSGRIDTA